MSQHKHESDASELMVQAYVRNGEAWAVFADALSTDEIGSTGRWIGIKQSDMMVIEP